MIKITETRRKLIIQSLKVFYDEPEEVQGNGILKHDNIKELVNRYVAAVKLFDEQIAAGIKMKNLVSSFYSGDLCFQVTQDKTVKTVRSLKGLTKSG